MNDTPTPRTDLKAHFVDFTHEGLWYRNDVKGTHVEADFARELERESAAKDALIAKLRSAVADLAGDALAYIPDIPAGGFIDRHLSAAHAALAATPESASQELAALREDKARLDWLAAQGKPNTPWIARQSITDRGFRLHQTDDYAKCAPNPRAAIDAARTPANTEGKP